MLEPRQLLAADSVTTAFDNGVVNELNPTAEIAVNLDAGQRIAIAATSDEFDPQLRFLNSAGGQLRSDQDSGPGQDALISHYVVQSSGQYLVEVSAESGTGNFDLRIDVVSDIDLESDENNANDSIGGADPIRFSTAGTTQTAEVAGTLSAFDTDLFQLGFLNAGELVSLDANSFSPIASTLQPFVDVVSSDGQVVFDSDSSDGVFSGEVPTTGEFYARVSTKVAAIDGSRFVLSDATASWSELRNSAIATGQDLASITSAQQNELLYETFGIGVWIGLTDETTEGTFVWSDGTPLSFTKWNGGTPSGGDYTYITSNGEWRNDNNGNRFGIIESVIEATDRTFAGRGFRSQYNLKVGVTDGVAPIVEHVSSLPNNGGTLTDVLSTFTVNFSEDIDQSTLVDANFELRGAG
ncbi:lectin-like protein, partial [Roseiconus sp. JC912]